MVGENKAPKKGKRTWKKANLLDVRDKNPNYRYRFVQNDPMVIQRRLAENWLFVDGTGGVGGEHERPEGVNDGKKLTTVTEYRDVVLMALPNDWAEARDEYQQELSDRQVADVEEDLRSRARGAGSIGNDLAHGIYNPTIIS